MVSYDREDWFGRISGDLSRHTGHRNNEGFDSKKAGRFEQFEKEFTRKDVAVCPTDSGPL